MARPDLDHYIRVNGSDTAASGTFDPTVAGAGTNYADRDTVILTDTNGVTYGTTKFTTASGNFNSTYIGNSVRINGDGDFTILVVVSATEVTLDRTTATSAGSKTFFIGRAWASPKPLCTTSSTGAPTMTSPLEPGNEVFIETSGEFPTTPTFTGWATGFVFPEGAGPETLTGAIKFLPRTAGERWRLNLSGAFMLDASAHVLSGGYFQAASALSDGIFLDANMTAGKYPSWVYDTIFDQHGYGVAGFNWGNAIDSVGVNTAGGGSVDPNISFPFYKGEAGGPGSTWGRIIGCSIVGWACGGFGCIEHPNAQDIEDCRIINPLVGYGIRAGEGIGPYSIKGNTIHGCAATYSGIRLYHWGMPGLVIVRNNILTSNGSYGLEHLVDEYPYPNRYNVPPDYNVYWNNNGGGAQIAGYVHGAHDIFPTANPYVDSAGLDFRLNEVSGQGGAVRRKGSPRSYYGTVA